MKLSVFLYDEFEKVKNKHDIDQTYENLTPLEKLNYDLEKEKEKRQNAEKINMNMKSDLEINEQILLEKSQEIEKIKFELENTKKHLHEVKENNGKLIHENEKLQKLVHISNAYFFSKKNIQKL